VLAREQERAASNSLKKETTKPAGLTDDGLVVEGIIDIGQALISACGGLIDLGWALHVQGFVRTFVVEDFDKVIEAGLLLKEVSPIAVASV